MPPQVQDFLEGISVWTAVIWGIAIVVAFPVVRKVWKLLKRLADFLDDVNGEDARPGVPARPGLMERVMRIEHEMFPNSGKSLRDQTNRMEQKLDRDNARIEELGDQVDGLGTQVDGLTGRLEEHITQSTQIIETLKGDNHQ